MLGITIGVLLLIKISILRFFSHFSGALPYLGSLLLLSTFLLIGLSVPFTLREHYLRTGAHVAGDVFGDESIQRVHTLLKTASLPGSAPLDRLASRRMLREGRVVLLSKCVVCHDLRTILAKPRTPRGWVHTVQRMATKPILGEPITQEDQWTVSTYLIAITPDLQVSAKIQRNQQLERTQVQTAFQTAMTVPSTSPSREVAYNPEAAKALFTELCTQCHDLSEVGNAPSASKEATRALIARMIENGLYIEEDQVQIVTRYLNETYTQNPGL